MALITALLPVLVLVLGLVVYFVCAGFSKATVGEVGKWCFICGTLAFLLASHVQSCSMSAGSSGGASAHSR